MIFIEDAEVAEVRLHGGGAEFMSDLLPICYRHWLELDEQPVDVADENEASFPGGETSYGSIHFDPGFEGVLQYSGTLPTTNKNSVRQNAEDLVAAGQFVTQQHAAISSNDISQRDHYGQQAPEDREHTRIRGEKPHEGVDDKSEAHWQCSQAFEGIKLRGVPIQRNDVEKGSNHDCRYRIEHVAGEARDHQHCQVAHERRPPASADWSVDGADSKYISDSGKLLRTLDNRLLSVLVVVDPGSVPHWDGSEEILVLQ
mmetsp:Transcript_61962/g.134282  ORF Transcript_61962/g.134282 Transcript_61962/m.134282 type:complete len:257 (+) Transcript_61962:190-960(+)